MFHFETPIERSAKNIKTEETLIGIWVEQRRHASQGLL
jgi:hypothetical protein